MEHDVHASMALPDPLRGNGRLFLWPSNRDIAERLQGLAQASRWRVDRYEAHGCLALHLEEPRVLGLLDALRKCLDPGALESTRALFKSGLDEPCLVDFPRADSLRAFIAFARAQWLGEMIANRRLTAWFQPIVEASVPHRVVALEALARGFSTDDDATRTILPGRLLSAARDAGLMRVFDRYVHEQALERLVELQLEGVDLFLNVTPRTLEDPAFDIEELVVSSVEHGVHPERITLEIIECETIADLARMQDVLTAARASGMGIALDDLGAGYSNLNLIHQLRPDVVKLDMALIRDIAADGYKAVIAQKVLEATRRLGVRTVAEGVESAAELAWLRAHGVDMVQGFIVGRPSPSPSIVRATQALSA